MLIKYANATFIGDNPAPSTYEAIVDKRPRQGQKYFIAIQESPKGIAASIFAVTRKSSATTEEARMEIKEAKRAKTYSWIQYADETEFKLYWSEVSIVPIEQVRIMLDDPHLV